MDTEAATLFQKVVRAPQSDPFILIPASSAPTDNRTIQLSGGSVWLDATLFGGPVGFLGLRISGGTLSFNRPARFVGGNVLIRAEATATLTVQVDAQNQQGPASGPGADAAAALAELPADAVFVFAPQGLDTVNASRSSITAYGSRVDLSRSQSRPFFDADAGLVLIPFVPAGPEFSIRKSLSPLFRPEGTSSLTGAAWAHSVALTQAERLGDAAGAGALALMLGPGMKAGWQGLSQPMRLDGATILVDGRQLTLSAPVAVNRRSSMSLALWRESGTLRDSTLEIAFDRPFPLLYVSSRSGEESVQATGMTSAHFDRPVQTDGRSLQFDHVEAALRLTEDPAGRTVSITALRQRPPANVPLQPELVSLALTNALLTTTEAESLSLTGAVQGGNRVTAGTVTLTMGVFGILPILPDPYAANFNPQLPAGGADPNAPAPALLVARIAWPDAGADLSLFLEADGNRLLSLLPQPPAPGGGQEPFEVQRMRALFDITLGGAAPESLLLLDLSTNADQLGVGMGFRPVSPPGVSPIAIQDISLAAPGFNLRVFMLPQVQWEPVTDVPNPNAPFPAKLHALDDGGPALLGVDTVKLVPAAPVPLTSQFLDTYTNDHAAAAALFTLPFGIKAVTLVERAFPLEKRPAIAFDRPDFGALRGGMQIRLEAGAPFNPGQPPAIPGAAFQTRHNRELHPITQQPVSVLGENEPFFNREFGPTGTRPSVPVSRIDLSGYGASCFSDWVDRDVRPPGVSEVRFDVLVGRTSYEVVQVTSILWPCQAIVVRTVTMERKGNARVTRKDSGWVAATPGVFQAPGSQSVFHPGVVRGMYNIREIRDTPQVVNPDPGVEFAAVYFDTDIAFENVVRGHGATGLGPHNEPVGFVPAQRQLGFVQRLPLGRPNDPPLLPRQLAALFSSQGLIGGHVDCELDIGGSGQRMRITGVYADVALPSQGDPEFCVAAFGAPRLPSAGQWSITHTQNRGANIVDGANTSDPQPVDRDLGVPLIREGAATQPATAAPYRLADPADLLQAADPAADYSLLFAAEAHRILFRRPKIETGDKRITSALSPLLADPYTLALAEGLFPKAKDAVGFPGNLFFLDVVGEGQLRLSPSPFQFDVTPHRILPLVGTSSGAMRADYSDGGDPPSALTKVTITIDSTASPPYSLVMAPISLVQDIGPFSRLMRLVCDLEARSAPQLVNPVVRFGSVLSPVQEIITILQNFGLHAPLPLAALATDGGKLKLKMNFVFAIPTIIEGRLQDEINIGGCDKFKGDLKTGFELDATNNFRGKALVELKGSYQHTVHPFEKLLYAGGFFKFKMSLNLAKTQTAPPEPDYQIELSTGVIGSLGGDLIPKLFKLEGSRTLGFLLLIDEKAQQDEDKVKPGATIGLEVKAELAKSLLAVTFEWEGQGILRRPSQLADEIDVKARMTVAAGITFAVFLETSVELELEYTERVKAEVVAALSLALGLGLLPLP